MYAGNGVMFPYFHSLPHELQHLEDLWCSQRPNNSISNLFETSTISEYDLGVEGDLFKAPGPIIEEPVISVDPMTSVISMIDCGENVISSQGLKVSEIESSLENGQLLSEIFYECKKDLLAKEATDTPLSEVLDFKITLPESNESLITPEQFQKSNSSGSLSSMRPNFLDFSGVDLDIATGMRRAYSEGDIKALRNENISLVQSPLGQPQVNTINTSEDRKEKLSRYRDKKNKRNFGRKIKYACRKALADTQPRIRGRFAKTEDMEISKKL